MKNRIQKTLAVFLLGAVLISTLTGFTYADSLASLLQPVDTVDVSPNVPPSGSTPKDDTAPTAPSTSDKDPVGQTLPLFDLAIKTGTVFPLQCTAPAGAKVTATVNGKTYALAHNRKVNSSTYVAHKSNYKMPSVTGTVDLGPVVYTVTYKGKSYKKESPGKLFAVGTEHTLRVIMKNNSATVFNKPANSKKSGYRTVAHKGAVDTVVEYHGDMYKLGTGGWINASNATPLTKNYAINNSLKATSFRKNSDGSEIIRLEGAAHPVYTSNYTKDGLEITLYRTTGASTPDVSTSSIFSSAKVSQNNGHTTVYLTTKEAWGLWGYAVEYSGGTTDIVCRPRPTLSSEPQPLKGITIALDPGHGGKDNGTNGVSNGKSWVEKDANLATARATRDLLESKGASVVMVRNADEKIELSDRMDHAQSERADLYISIHCNSAPNKNAQGVEIYYHQPNSWKLANAMEQEFPKATERKSRGVEKSHYIVTLGSYAPSILLEMGFMSNASEYNDLCSQKGVDNAAEGIYQGILSALQ